MIQGALTMTKLKMHGPENANFGKFLHCFVVFLKLHNNYVSTFKVY